MATPEDTREYNLDRAILGEDFADAWGNGYLKRYRDRIAAELVSNGMAEDRARAVAMNFITRTVHQYAL